jgi:hypothetical protein
VLRDRRHAELALGDPRRELAGPALDGRIRIAPGVEPEQDPPRLVRRRVAEMEAAVDAPGPHQRGIEALGVIRCQEQEPAFPRANPVERVEETAHRDPVGFVRLPLRAEGTVDVFQQQNGSTTSAGSAPARRAK